MQSRRELAEFILNGKFGNLFEIEKTEEEVSKQDGSVLIYKDRNISIYYIFDNEISNIDKVVIFSKWFGRIKNSFFLLQGERVKLKEKVGAYCLVEDLEKYRYKREISVNDTNRALRDSGKPVVTHSDFTEFVQKIQKEYGASPSYRVVEVLSKTPNPLVKVEISLPNGEVHYEVGKNKKEATNNFVKNYYNE